MPAPRRLLIHTAFFLLLRTLSAQTGTGELRLSVKDGASAPVPAAVELENQSTQTRQSVDRDCCHRAD